MHLIFIARVYLHLQFIERAVRIYYGIMNVGDIIFHGWPYLHSQMAVAHYYMMGKNNGNNL